jgi:hypothetical protein
MKTIEVQGRTLQYETLWVRYGEDYGSDPVTVFYEGTQTVSRKRWLLFGPTIESQQPKEVFRIYADTENLDLSKSWWRKQITLKLELLNRKEEIEKGELI